MEQSDNARWLTKLAIRLGQVLVISCCLLFGCDAIFYLAHWVERTLFQRSRGWTELCESRQMEVFRIVEKLLANEDGNPSQKPLPFSLESFATLSTECPVALGCGERQKAAPFLLVYAIRRRDSSYWSRPQMRTKEPIPIVIGAPHADQGSPRKDPTLFSDSCFYDMPLSVWQFRMAVCREDSSDSITAVEIEIPDNDPRVPFTREISALRAQFLAKPPIEIDAGGVSWPRRIVAQGFKTTELKEKQAPQKGGGK